MRVPSVTGGLPGLAATNCALHDESLAQGIAAIDSAQSTLHPKLEQLRMLPYFRLYSCDLMASCEYIPQELFECYTESCEVYPVDDEDVPEDIKTADFDEHDFELDGWARWDMPSDDYYDTVQFSEDYTGYDGRDVWSFIHDRIGFHEGDMATDKYDADSWKADFNKAVSGLHAMVSAQVIRGINDKLAAGEQLDPESYPWTDPHAEYHRRLGSQGETPESVENMYFTMMLLLSGVRTARERLKEECTKGNIGDDKAVQTLQSILAHPLLDDPSIDAASHRLREHALQDRNNLWEARMRTRDLMRVMNCVQCNKCRFHGKISVLGISTALQLAVGHRGKGGDITKIHRVELASLLLAISKFSSGIDLCLQMQDGTMRT